MDIRAAAFVEGPPMLQLIGSTVGMQIVSGSLNPGQVRSINKAMRNVQAASTQVQVQLHCLRHRTKGTRAASAARATPGSLEGLVALVAMWLLAGCQVASASTNPSCGIVKMWIGYNQSLRPCQSGLTRNICVSMHGHHSSSLPGGAAMLQLIGTIVAMQNVSQGLAASTQAKSGASTEPSRVIQGCPGLQTLNLRKKSTDWRQKNSRDVGGVSRVSNHKSSSCNVSTGKPLLSLLWPVSHFAVEARNQLSTSSVRYMYQREGRSRLC
ncbi:TPA: hypothetical protein ACH3X3_004833 [Trebouxia sp. C0006]